MAKCRSFTISFFFLAFLAGFGSLSVSDYAHAAAPVLNSIILSDPDSGSTAYTNNSTVNVSLSASGSPTQMILSKYNDFHGASWITYANPATFSFEIPTSNGTRTVYCKLKNASSEESNVVQDDITVDTFKPAISTANSGPVNTTHVDIMFSDIIIVGADNPANYTITNGVTVLAAQFVWVSSASLYKYRLSTTAQTPGAQYTVTASTNLQDWAGNLIDPNGRTFTYTAASVTDTTKPTVSSFSIDDADGYTRSRDVSILMTESDMGGLVKKWLITPTLSTPPSSAFTLTSRPTSYTLSEGNGTKTLYAWVMDDSGNVSMYNPAHTTDSIILDETSPNPEYLKVGGTNPDYNTIMDAMAHIATGGTVYVYAGVYPEIVHLKNNVTLKGDSNETVIIKGGIIAEEVAGTVENLTILYHEGTMLSFDNANYIGLKLVADAGITAVNSPLTIKKCIIKPDLEYINNEGGYDPPLEYYGKGVQIWNMYGTGSLAPQIESNLIQNTDCGIYYFSQAFGGAILGSIKNNTFYHNKDGVILRMHKENPHIYNNIFDSSANSAIFLAYEDGDLFTQRKEKINNNLFNQSIQSFSLDGNDKSSQIIGIRYNVQDDPLFADPLHGDFLLKPGSPCLGAGEGGEDIGAFGQATISELFIEITSPQDGITIYPEP